MSLRVLGTLVLGMLCATSAHARLLIRTLAGRGIGDGRPATAASLDGPTSVAVALDGALLVADRRHHRIRRVDPATGVITTFAGTIAGGGANGGPADQSRLKGPLRVRVFPGSGDVLIAEYDAHTVRRVAAATGIITRVAGTMDTPGASGDDGPATAALLRNPADAAPDGAGGWWIADSGNHRVRHVDPAGTIITVAGTGTAGYDGDAGPAVDARLRTPVCVLAAPGGGFWICDQGNHVIRFVDADGDISTVAGTGSGGFTGDGVATEVALRAPTDLALDGAGGLLIVDQGNDRLRRLDLATGTLTTLTGNGTQAFSHDGSDALGSSVAEPTGVTVAPDGRIVFAESSAHRVRAIDTGKLLTIAGDGVSRFGGDGGPALDATFGELKCMTPAPDGDLILSDAGNNRVRRLDAATGTVTTVAGSGVGTFGGDAGPALAAGLSMSDALLDAAGNLLVSDSDNHRIRRVDAATGIITTIVGTGVGGFSGDGGPAAEAQINRPTGIELDAQGNLYVADFRNHRIRRVDAGTGVITTVAGTGTAGFDGDGVPATAAALNSPTDLLVEPSGDLFIADFLNHRIRRVDAVTGLISTVAGTGTPGAGGDGGPATAAQLREPSDVKRGADGRLWVVDSANHKIRRFTPGGTIETVAGTGAPGYAGDDGPAAAARLLIPLRLLALPDGRVLVADRGNFVVRALLPDEDDDGVPDGADTDGDGVAGGADTCPTSPAGAAVDATGCACGEPGHVACDDGDACTADACEAATAACTTTPVECPPPDPCAVPGACPGPDPCAAPGRCGNGMVETACGETCDEGAANGTGCCSATCTLVDGDGDGVCDRDDDTCAAPPGPAPLLHVGRLATPPGDDTLVLTGRLASPFAALDPAAHGLRVIVEDAAHAVLLDDTIAAGDAWRRSRRRLLWRFVDRRRPGIRKARLAARRKRPDEVRFSLRAAGAAFPPSDPLLPLTVRLGLARAAVGPCAEWRLDAVACRFNRRHTTYSCR